MTREQEHKMADDFFIAEDEAAYMYDVEGYRKQSGWVSVKYELPEIGKDVLGYSENKREFFVVAYSDTYRTFFSGQFANDDITHWMPLPEPPEEGWS